MSSKLRTTASSSSSESPVTELALPGGPSVSPVDWLPVVYQIKFKLATVTYHTLYIQQPTYLVNLVHFYDRYS